MHPHKNVNLAQFTTYGIGGSARYFVVASSEKDITRSVKWAKKKNIPYFILGGGSNVLISDDGYDGLVIHLQNKEYKVKDNILEAGAGTDMQTLVNLTAEAGLEGLEWAGGLPGQLGGAIRGNAGAFGGEMKDIVISVRALTPTGRIMEFFNNECEFSYRQSVFKRNGGYVILSAKLQMNTGDSTLLKNKVAELVTWRKERHPMEYGNCGSVFKSVDLENLPPKFLELYPDSENAIRENRLATAYLIDQCGLKNKRVGSIEVSDKHPNFLVNRKSKGRAEDVAVLASLVKARVREDFDVMLEEEIQYVGFS